MHTVHIYIDEGLDVTDFEPLRTELLSDPHVANVQCSAHELLVEYEERFVGPSHFTHVVRKHGLHGDVTAC